MVTIPHNYTDLNTHWEEKCDGLIDKMIDARGLTKTKQNEIVERHNYINSLLALIETKKKMSLFTKLQDDIKEFVQGKVKISNYVSKDDTTYIL